MKAKSILGLLLYRYSFRTVPTASVSATIASPPSSRKARRSDATVSTARGTDIPRRNATNRPLGTAGAHDSCSILANCEVSPIRIRGGCCETTTRDEDLYKKACPLFVWDAPSAVRYHLCKRLVRDRIYEGLGGKKFVRLKPGSLLKDLYPCSQHKPDRCLFCERTFRDHLRHRWEKRGYDNTPYNLYLDEVSERGTVSDEVVYGGSTTNGIRRKTNGGRKEMTRNRKRTGPATIPEAVVPPLKLFAFHSDYVDRFDVRNHETLAPEKRISDRGERKRPGRTEGRNPRDKRPSETEPASKTPPRTFETRGIQGSQFRIPVSSVVTTDADASVGDAGAAFPPMLALAREISILKLEILLRIQRIENRLLMRRGGRSWGM